MDTVAPTRPLRVGEVARAAGVTTDTIRYYKREGLIPPPERTPSGYRAYPAGAVDRMAFIQRGPIFRARP